MNKELENKALEIIQKLQTYNPAAGDDSRWFKQCLLDLEDIIIDDEISPKERERLKRIENRKKLGTNMDNTLYDNLKKNNIQIAVSAPQAEIVYSKWCSKTDAAADIIIEMCSKYGVKQIFIQDDHFGTNLLDLLSQKGMDDSMDIVKFNYMEA